MNKKIIYISSTILAVIAIVAMFVIMNLNQTKVAGKIHLYVTITEEEVVVIDKEVEFYEEENLIDVLNRHLEIEEGTGSQSGMIIGINGSQTLDTSKYYYRIIVNCDWAQTGAWKLSLNDGDSIRITYTSTSDWSTGC